jgi:hypothetical protein
MKITVINKKTPIRKPTNYCPWLIDDPSDPGPDKR